jgi:hypothetical protein
MAIIRVLPRLNAKGDSKKDKGVDVAERPRLLD